MSRYKSVLKARRDAKEFAHHVDVPVPASGLGIRLDILNDWLVDKVGNEWRQHGTNAAGVHVARFMFRTKIDADTFEAALRTGLLDGAQR